MTDHAAHEVLDIARSVLAELDVDAVLERVLVSAQKLTGAQYAALGVLNEAQTGLESFITAGIDEETRERIGPLPTGRGVLGELITRPVALRLTDVGAHPASYGFPAAHPAMRTFLGVPLLVGDKPFGNLYLTEKVGGGPFTEQDESAVVLLAEFAGVAIDHAHRYTRAETRRVELQRTVDALDATMQIARALSGETDLDVVLQLVAKRGRALVSARALVIEHQRDGELVVVAAAGQLPEGLVGERIDLSGTVAEAALRTRRAQQLDDELMKTKFEQHGLGRLGIQARAGLVVPLVFRGEAYGVLVALDRLDDGPEFTSEDLRLLEAFAASAASAVATARFAADERRSQRLAAVEEERGRWARELHDETLQGLGALKLGLASAARVGTAEALAEAVSASVEQLGDDIASLRSLISDLRPAALDELGPEAAIEQLAARLRATGTEVELSIDLAWEQGRTPQRHIPELETAVYRIVQEALTNARKHGHARRVVIEVQDDLDAATLRVRVQDDGNGFDPTAQTDGFGLLGMGERAALLDGTLRLNSAPGEGATVTATFSARRRHTEAVSTSAVRGAAQG